MRQSNRGLLWVFAALAGCRAERAEPPQPKGAPAPVQSPSAPLPVASARPPRLPRALPKDPSAVEPSSPLWSTCAEGFAPGATPEVDVLRLGTACGPVNGQILLGKTSGTVGEALPPASYGWEARRGDCFRLVAVAADVEDLEIEIAGPKDTRRVVNQGRRWVLIDEDRPFCTREASDFKARVSTHGGQGHFALSVWRGARMLPMD